MPTSGPDIHRQLINAYNDAGTRVETLRGALSRTEAERDELQSDRNASLEQLARHYLPELTPESISETWAEFRPTIRDMLLRKQDETRRLSDALADDTVIRQGLEDQLFEINETIETLEREQDRIAVAVEDDLKARPTFIELSDRAAMAEAALERAQANLDEVSQDSAKKLPAYDECKLFTYLRRRGFGTDSYQHRGFTRRMDRMIAKMTNYTQSSRDYEFLTTTPETMRTIMAEDRYALDTVLDELARIRDEVANANGLPAKMAAAHEMREQRQATIADLEVTTERCESTMSRLNELESPRGAYYIDAIEVFRGMLSRLNVDDLRRQARRTPEITDDQIVATLRGIDSEMDETELSTAQRTDDLQSGESVHAAIGRLLQRFRASGFDAARCQFVDRLNVAGDLSVARHPRDVDEVWNSIRRSQRWGPSIMDRVTAVATHPMTQVLVNAMAHAAAGAMRDHARRAGRRRRY
ncbi:MAG: hypothetical protein AAF670_03675 [Planctomycetota bacterium]